MIDDELLYSRFEERYLRRIVENGKGYLDRRALTLLNLALLLGIQFQSAVLLSCLSLTSKPVTASTQQPQHRTLHLSIPHINSYTVTPMLKSTNFA